MKKLKPTLILAFLAVNFAFGQEFKIERTTADSLREVGDLKGAIVEYAKIFAENPDNKTNTYNYACALALSQKTDTAFYYLNLATLGDTTIQPLNDPDFYFLLQNKEKWAAFQNRLIERVETKLGKYENVELSKELWTMKIKDQAFYYHLEVAEAVAGRFSPVISALWELKSKLNEENLTRIQEIIEKDGWPKSSVVGGNAAGTVFLIVQHSDIEVQKKYLPLMKEAADKGEASWASLALLIDRVNLREGKEQIYGSQVYRNEDGTYFVKDLFEPEYVNQRRKEVGLGPIQDYVGRWGVEWKIEQKEK